MRCECIINTSKDKPGIARSGCPLDVFLSENYEQNKNILQKFAIKVNSFAL